MEMWWSSALTCEADCRFAHEPIGEVKNRAKSLPSKARRDRSDVTPKSRFAHEPKGEVKNRAKSLPSKAPRDTKRFAYMLKEEAYYVI